MGVFVVVVKVNLVCTKCPNVWLLTSDDNSSCSGLGLLYTRMLVQRTCQRPKFTWVYPCSPGTKWLPLFWQSEQSGMDHTQTGQDWLLHCGSVLNWNTVLSRTAWLYCGSVLHCITVLYWTDPYRCNSTNRQNSPFQLNWFNFCINDAVLMSFKNYNALIMCIICYDWRHIF